MTIYKDDHLVNSSFENNLKDDILYFQWLYTRLESSKTNLWIIGLRPHPYEDTWSEFVVEKYNQLSVKPDKILLNIPPDNYSTKAWDNLIDTLIGLGYDNSQLMGIYSSFTSPIPKIPCLADYKFLNRYLVYEKINYTDIFSRKYKFVSLAGMARPNRIMFTKELLMRNLQDHGIITCGSLGESYIKERSNTLYDFLDLGNYRSQFPIIHDSEFADSDSDKIHTPFLDAVYNVVQESAFEDYLNLKDHPEFFVFISAGSLPLMTEKTTKAFGSYQIPVFVASKGYVAEIRKLGFDVFDDIVDHSYDSINDPQQRMIFIANEVERLVNIKLPDNIKNRLINNYSLIKELYFKEKQRVSLEILKWFNQ